MERHHPGRPVVVRFVSLLALAVWAAGCGGPSAEKPTASRSSRPSATAGGKKSEYAPPITKQEPAVPAEKPAEKGAPETAAASSPAAEPAAQPAQSGEANAKPAATPTQPESAPEKPAEAAPAPAVPAFGQAEPLDLIMPQVLMTVSESKTCLVKVGDVLPDVRLPELGDGEVALNSLYGKRLTVVVFWRATHPYAVEELGDLQRLVASRFADQQVKVVGIDVKDQPEVVKETVAAKKIEFPNLLDAAGTAYAQVATEYMPRTYLVDAGGKILWFDMEYSRSTRRDLLRAIRATLAANE